jgi:hypothetical protein
MFLKFARALFVVLFIFTTLGIESSSAAAQTPAYAAAGTFACKKATAVNKVATPPPIWEHPGGKAPNAQQVARSSETEPLCPAGQIPSLPKASGLIATDPMPTRESRMAEFEPNVDDEPNATPAADGGTGCRKGGCYWYTYNEVSKPAVGMEYETNISEPLERGQRSNPSNPNAAPKEERCRVGASQRRDGRDPLEEAACWSLVACRIASGTRLRPAPSPVAGQCILCPMNRFSEVTDAIGWGG